MKDFVGEYGVEDGFVHGGRSHSFSVRASDLEDDMSEHDLILFYEEAVQDAFQNSVTPYPKKVDEFVVWALDALAEREKEEETV
jgi:hypothetical protein